MEILSSQPNDHLHITFAAWRQLLSCSKITNWFLCLGKEKVCFFLFQFIIQTSQLLTTELCSNSLLKFLQFIIKNSFKKLLNTEKKFSFKQILFRLRWFSPQFSFWDSYKCIFLIQSISCLKNDDLFLCWASKYKYLNADLYSFVFIHKEPIFFLNYS